MNFSKCSFNNGWWWVTWREGFSIISPCTGSAQQAHCPSQLGSVCVQKQIGNDQLKIINLSSKVLSPFEIEVLGLGLSFCPTSRADPFEAVKDLNLFARRLTYKYIYDKEKKKKKQELIEHEQWKGFTVREFMDLKDLMDLLDENNTVMGALRRGVPQNPNRRSPLRHNPWWTIPGFAKNPHSFPLWKRTPTFGPFCPRLHLILKNYILVLFVIKISPLSNNRHSINCKTTGI